MFGFHSLPFSIELDNINLSIKRDGGGYLYYRKCEDDEKEQYIFADKCMVLINPIEPVNTPKEITHYLFIELEKPVVLEPKGRQAVYIKFPVEIGVFIGRDQKRNMEILDIFSISYKKYILYGEIQQGILCKYFKSNVYTEIPEVDILKEGIIELDIINKTDRWVKVSKTVFDAYHMKIYYSDKLVAMKGIMTVVDEGIAETTFKDSPLEKGMEKSLELYVSRKIPMFSTEFVMEWGL
ncbi:MAG: DUF432 domain-containing protein [Nitrospirae bacterium]|nr:MAG: DUF432 domain-containing protein [Nitrospirota bacterium]